MKKAWMMMTLAGWMLIASGCSTTPSVVSMPALPPLPPIECLMTCENLPEADAGLARWALKAVHAYEICAARHNDCAARLGDD